MEDVNTFYGISENESLKYEEEISWAFIKSLVPNNLIGKILDDESELVDLIKEDENYSDVKILQISHKDHFSRMLERLFKRHINDTAIYGRARKIEKNMGVLHKIAYKCGGCNKIIIDAPKIESNFTRYIFLKGFDVSCINCGHIFYREDGK